MYRQRVRDLIAKVPLGMWFFAFGLSVQFSPAMVYKIKGGSVICAIFLLGMFLCKSNYCKEGFFNAFTRAAHENSGKCFLLFIFYMITVTAWFYAPYEMTYADIQHIWKKLLLNVVAIFVGLFMSRYPHYIKTILVLCIPFALLQTEGMKEVAAEGLEARNLLGKEGGGVMGGFTQWESIAMLTIMLVGLLMTVNNKLIKIALGVIIAFFSWAVLKAGYATPFAVLLIGYGTIGLAFLKYGSSRQTHIMTKISVFAVFLLGSVVIFMKIAKSADTGNEASVSVASRFSRFISEPTGGGYDANYSRFALMSLGWDSFCKSPIFGRGGEYPSPRYEVSGGHHALVDYLGHYGLIGGGAYLLFVLLTMKYLFKRYAQTRDWLDCSKMAVSVMFFVGGVVNPGWMELPMSSYLILCAPFVNRSEFSYRRFYEPMPPPNMPYYGGVY